MTSWRALLAASAGAAFLAAPAGFAAPAPAACLAESLRELPPTHPSPPRAQAADPYSAAQLGIDWLMNNLCTWMSGEGVAYDCTDGVSKTCMGCHVQAETVLGLARSSTRCYTLPDTACRLTGDESPLQFAVRFIAEAQRKDCIIGPRAACANFQDLTTVDGYFANLGSIGHYGPCGSNAGPASVHPIMQSTHGGLALTGYAEYVSPTYSSSLVALADWLVTQQDPSGRWIPDRFEAPVDQGEAFTTGASILVLEGASRYASAAQVLAYSNAIDMAIAWVETATLATTQDELFAMYVYMAGGIDPADPRVVTLREAIVGQQQPDGGWAERAGLSSNAYATGQALTALLEAGTSVDRPQVCSGIQWLVDRQNIDGSWSQGTPGLETDSSRNSFFTATIWPVLALGSLRPFGAIVAVPSPDQQTCAAETTFEVEISHAADTACGLFARLDTYDISVSNDRGDTVWAEPPAFRLAAGGRQTVAVHWRRNGGVPPVGTLSTTLVEVNSEGAVRAGCPMSTTTSVSVTVPPMTTPPALDDSLRVHRYEGRIELKWAPMAAGTAGGYEVVAVSCAQRDNCTENPTPTVLDARAAIATLPIAPTRTTFAGHATPGSPALIFYKVRALSPCYLVPGPTCERVCPTRDACDENCP